MNMRPFGSTGIAVPEIGFGAWAVGAHLWGEVRDEDSIEALQAAHDLGVRFFDTAQEYGCGHSECIVGEALAGRDDLFVATKVGKWWYGDTFDTYQTDYSAAFISGMADGSLCRLKRDVIDLYQLHNPGAEVCRRDATWKALENLIRFGKIRFYGASITSEEELNLCLEHRCAAVQFEYNILRPQRRPWIARCAEAGVAVIVRTPLAYGALSGKYSPNYLLPQDDFRHEARWGGKSFRKFVRQAQDLRFLERPGQTMAQAALRYILADPGVSVVIPGGKTPEQVRDNCAADGTLSPGDLARLAEVQQQWPADDK